MSLPTVGTRSLFFLVGTTAAQPSVLTHLRTTQARFRQRRTFHGNMGNTADAGQEQSPVVQTTQLHQTLHYILGNDQTQDTAERTSGAPGSKGEGRSAGPAGP